MAPGRAQALPASEGQVADSTELRVLRQFYAATGGAQWSNNTNWLQGTSNADFATWTGVQVSGGDVVVLALSGNNLTGTLPTGLAALSSLVSLNLENNQLTGSLPPAGWPRLSWLSANANQFTGSIPASWGRLRELRYLLLDHNKLSGPLPDSLSRCASLYYVRLGVNQFTGSLPASWGQITHLNHLWLAGNQLSGPLPAELNQLHELATLGLDFNQLTGPLPTHWEGLTSLANLDLSNNQFSGPLPASFGQLPALSYCSLGHNQFSGQLPAPSGAGWRQLTLLDARNNRLSGPLSDSLAHCQALTSLYLSSNQLTGPLPAGLGQCAQLQWLFLDHNQLDQQLPADWGQLRRLSQLYLIDNHLSGFIPASWGRMRNLQTLELGYNKLSGTLPDSLRNLRGLAFLGLSGNALRGSLAPLTGMTNLGGVSAEHNQFDEPLPTGLGALANLSALYLSDNRLPGTIPPDLGQAPRLWQLLLAGNRLTGTIPANVLRSPSLYELYLNNNQFTDIEDLGVAVQLPALGNLGGNELSFASIERLYQGPGQSRFRGIWYNPLGMDARWQRPPSQVDTVRYQAGDTLRLRPSAPVPAPHGYAYQWQRLVNGQWVNLPGDTLLTKTWLRAPAGAQGSYRRAEHHRWFRDGQAAPTELYSQAVYADLLPYRPLAQNRPDDTNQGLPIQPLTAADSAAWHSAAAPSDINYVRSWAPRVALTQAGRVTQAPVDSVAMSTQYLDGLGRSVQTVLRQASPQRRDMVQAQAYDGLGREPRAYLPYPGQKAGEGDYYPQALRQQDAFYRPSTSPTPPALADPTRGVARTGAAYAETQFEASPLSRITAQGAAGEAWQLGAHAVTRQERTNTAADSVLWFVPGYDATSQDPGYRGFYAAGELWGTDVSEPHGPREPGERGFRTIEWKDKSGQVVLRQVEAARTGTARTGLYSRWLRTAYVYDDFGHLRFVVQPEGIKRLLLPVGGPSAPGTLAREQWDNVPGSNIGDIPLGLPPTRLTTLSSLEGPTNQVTATGQDFAYADRTRGYLLAPQDGAYSFWLASDDNAELWLSSDEDPAHKQRIAWIPGGWTNSREWTRYPQQQSAPVVLQKGQRYYLEVLHKEWGGGDNMAVTWRLPDGTGFGLPISGQYLAPFVVPKTVAEVVAPYLFHYRYDGRGRQIAKRVPGQAGETLVVFDQLDRPILSQDAQQRSRKEWSCTKYDALGRIILSGLVIQQDTIGQVRLQALASADTATSHQYEERVRAGAGTPAVGGYSYLQSFPRMGQDGFTGGQALTLTYYDDYDFDNDGRADAAYDPSQDGQFPSGQAPVADAVRTTSLVTRTTTRVLGVVETDDASQPAAWLTTTTFYDERARPVQVQATNARKGTDILTTQLDFTGKVVQSVAFHQSALLDAPLLVKEQFTYDHTGRLLTSRQQLPGEARPVLLDSVQYNEIGQVVRKALGTGRLRQEVDYAYNIRGWLTSLNDPYFPVKEDLFNLSLHYERGFTHGYEQYNGNLTGQTWRGRDGVQRAYGYVYDPLNRLLQGDFVARQLAPAAGAWRAEEDNYRLSFVSYDDNGNLLTLRRRGLLQNASSRQSKQYGAVDNLTYAYQGNRLLAVDDAVSGNQLPQPATYHGAPTSLAGDFQEAGTQLAEEYLYDANGNLTQDKNKGITGIAYNHLNLPQQIRFGQVGDSVVFRYAANGQKVAKLVYQTGKPVLRTDYLGPYQYEQDSLRFFPHAEGRVLRFVSYDAARAPHVSYQREFTFKDHLGNLRLAYRAGQARTYLASLEQDATTRRRETQQFDSLSVSQPIAVATPWAMGQYAARLNAGGSAPQPLGPLTQLTVQKGDTLRVRVSGLYPQRVNNSRFAFSLASFVAGLLQPAPAGAPPRADGSRRGGLPLLQVGLNAAALTAIQQLGSGVPKGYLRVLVFNQDSVLIDQRKFQLSQAALRHYELLGDTLTIRRDGYVTVYVGNESPTDVIFDELRVEHRQGLQVQENQYDPYGLDLAGVSGAAPGLRLKNFYQFNGKENQLDLGLSWNHHDWRFFDYQLGRWHAVDPLIEDGMEHWTPYSFGLDNAVRYNDPDGQFPPLLIAGAAGAAVGAIIGAGIEAGTQMYRNGGHVSDWHAVGGAALQGGVTGGVAGLTGGTSLLRSGAVGAISNVAGGIARNVYDGKPVTVGSVAKDAAVGAVTGVVGHAAGKVAGKLLTKACGCFTAGTAISTRKGRKAIEQVQVGDSVWAYNERTRQTALRPVTHLFRYERDTVYVLHAATGEVLRTTSDHPFYVRGQWVRVKRLRVGDSLVSQSGQRHVLRRIELKPEHVTVYNFTVDKLHTYFVGQNAILVHNSGPCPLGGSWMKTPESMSARAAAYQEQITGRAAGESYVLNGIKFDGKQGNTLVDAKMASEGTYIKALDTKTGLFKPWFKGAQGLIDQAGRQLKAANGASIEWHFDSQAVRDATQKLFNQAGIQGVKLIFTPAK